MTSCRFLANTAGTDGGAISSFGALHLHGVLQFEGNMASSGSGGAINLAWTDFPPPSSFQLANARFFRNRCALRGGALLLDLRMGTPQVDCVDCMFANDPDATPCYFLQNGTWRAWNDSVAIHISQTEFVANVANVSGGALAISNGALGVRTTQFSHNSAGTVGGGLYLANPFGDCVVEMNASAVNFSHNIAQTAAHVYSESGATLRFVNHSLFHGSTRPNILVDMQVATGGQVLFDGSSGLQCEPGYELSSIIVVPYKSTPFPGWSNYELCPTPNDAATADAYPSYFVQSIQHG